MEIWSRSLEIEDLIGLFGLIWGCVVVASAPTFIQMVEYMPLDHTLTALADPTRRAILGRLASGEARVTEVAAPFEMSLNAVSKHIRVLERAGLVRRRVSGREHLLALDLAPLEAASRWMEEQRAQWAWRLAELDRILKEEKP